MEQSPNLLSQDLTVDAEAHQHLLETAKWAKFLGIVGFIVSVILIIASIFASSFLATMGGGAMAAPAPGGLGVMISVLYVIMAVIYFVLSLYVYRFAVRMKQALLNTDQVNFVSGLHNLKLAYRISGIIVIVYLVLMVIGVIVTMAASAFV